MNQESPAFRHGECQSKKIFNFVQKNINMYVVKDVIRENSRLISYKTNGKPYKPKRILL